MVKIVGTVSVSAKGFIFLTPEDGSKDIHIKYKYAKNALNGDKVAVKIIRAERENHAAEGEVLEILEHNTKRVIGVIENGRSFSIITPDDSRITNEIYVPSRNVSGAKTGDKVVAEITKYPEQKDDFFKGKVVEVLGRFDAPGVDILSIMRSHNLYENFPEKVEKNLAEINDFVAEEEIKNRRDLRDIPIVTIDGEDAKDLDDGVYAEETQNNIRLIVAIADVSHYVTENTALDAEAYKRGTSVYLTDRVVPMLPKKLSNGICSLNENTDRLAMAGDFLIDDNGEVIKSEFYEAVIRVKRRLTYNVANKILVDKNPIFIKDNSDIIESLKTLKKLRNILFKRRENLGAIEFQTTEIKFKLDEQGKPVSVTKREGSFSESLIEECMLVANEEAAKLFVKKKTQGIYRVHPSPKEDAIDNLNEKISVLGYFLRKRAGGKVNSKDVQAIVEKSKGTDEESIINFTTLRAMEKAYYSEKNIGHFGLAKEFYTHFTSPIRRYPDLIVHRILKEILTKNTQKNSEKRAQKLKEIAIQTSAKERNAIEAEREATDLKAAEFLSNFIGEEFEGIITSVTNFGMFAELDNGIEGLVHVSNMMRDRYVYDARSFSLIGEKSGEEFKLGEKINIVVLKTDIKEKTIDFILADDAYILKNKEKNKPKKKAKTKVKKAVTFNKKNEKKFTKEKRKFYKKANKNGRKNKGKNRRI
ncbi:MAG: ribonuclease R [Selenomonadaceae bacterium]|nr:ribonuclease R [Selenomonadaceae bacterium]